VSDRYYIDVTRRKQSDADYKTKPFAASAWFGGRLVAVQYGSHPGLAFQAAWNCVQEDREREGVVGYGA